MAKLNGKIALVTGASRGLGRAIARRLAADGAHVIAHYGHAKAGAEGLAAETGATLVQADLAAPDGPAKLAAQVEGNIDILVNNAGVAHFGSFADETVEEFDRQFAVNVRAPFFLTQAFEKRINDGGRIIFLSSAVARVAFDGVPAYSATKGAISTLVLHLAPVFGARGITVNAVAPGAIATDMAGFLQSEEGQATAMAMQAVKRIGQPDDIADVVAFLASDDARWVTGDVIETGGGTKL